MHRFLLVAPLGTTEAATPSAPAGSGRRVLGMSMRTRDRFSADDFEQTVTVVVDAWQSTDTSPAGVPRVSLSCIRRVSANGQTFVTARAAMDGAMTSIESVEGVLTEAMERMVAETWQGTHVKWVNRTLITSQGENVGDWLLQDGDNQQVTMGSGSEQCMLVLGWGNNLFETNGASVTFEERLFAGLIDAQLVWGQLEAIAAPSELMVKAYASGQHEMLGGHSSAVRVGQLSRQMALHHLFYDKMLLHLQGVRGNVARAALKAWRYPDMSRRILHRVRELDHLVQQEDENSRRRYQGLVENVLLAIGVISLVQLVIALAQIAYTDGVMITSGGSRFSFLRFLRGVDLDTVLLTSMLASVLLFAWIVWHKRRQ